MTTDLAELWRARQEAGADFEEASDGNPDKGRAWTRYTAADEAIRAARPTDLAGLAVQAKLLADSIDIGHRDDDADLARAIAEQLEALASRS